MAILKEKLISHNMNNNACNATHDLSIKEVQFTTQFPTLEETEKHRDLWIFPDKKIEFRYAKKATQIVAEMMGGSKGRSARFSTNILDTISIENEDFTLKKDQSKVGNVSYIYKGKTKPMGPQESVAKESIAKERVTKPIIDKNKIKQQHASLQKQKISHEVTRETIKFNRNIGIKCEISRGHSVKLVYGRTQSAKTETCVKAILNRMEVDKCTGIFITRNSYKELKLQFKSIKNMVYNLTQGKITVKRASSDRKIVFKQLAESMRSEDCNTLYVVMGNSSNMTCLFTEFKKSDILRYTAIVDEADMYARDENQVNDKMKLLLDGCIAKYLVSATHLDTTSLIRDDERVEAIPSKFAFDDEIEGEDLCYRSIHKMLRMDLPRKEENVKDAIDNAKKILEMSQWNNWDTEWHNKGLPYMCCHFHSNKKTFNNNIAREVSKIRWAETHVTAFTFDAKGSTIYKNGEVIKKVNSLDETLSYLRKEKYIYIAAGQLFNRAFRVTDEKFEVYISTTVYGINLGDGDAAIALQRVGRACGLSKKELRCPQRIFIDKKAYNTILDATDANTEMIRTCHDLPEESFKHVKDQTRVPQRKSSGSLSLKGPDFKEDANKVSIHDPPRADEEEEVDAAEIGKYTIIDAEKFAEGSQVRNMILEVEKLLLDEGRINQDVRIKWVNEQMLSWVKYATITTDNIHGLIWTQIRNKKTNGSLISLNQMPQNEFVYWNDNGRIYVRLNQQTV